MLSVMKRSSSADGSGITSIVTIRTTPTAASRSVCFNSLRIVPAAPPTAAPLGAAMADTYTALLLATR